jgi:hypothetical protein
MGQVFSGGCPGGQISTSGLAGGGGGGSGGTIILDAPTVVINGLVSAPGGTGGAGGNGNWGGAGATGAPGDIDGHSGDMLLDDAVGDTGSGGGGGVGKIFVLTAGGGYTGTGLLRPSLWGCASLRMMCE